MSASLRPEGIPVFVDGDVVLTTPGLTGTASVHRAASPGMRSAEATTADFLAALEEADVTEQLTVEISGQAELDGRGATRAGGQGEEIVLEVPAPGEGNGQVLLYAAEDGSLTWHLPDSVPRAEVAQRGGERRTYRVPRAVVAASATEGGQRGLLGALGSKLLKVLVFPLIDPVLGKVGNHFAGRWEDRHRRNLVRRVTPGTLRQRDVPPLTSADWARLGTGPALLFLHGTFAMAHTAFSALPPDLLTELDRRYAGRLLALDHHTVSVTPGANIEWLAGALDAAGVHGPLVLDVVTHSRGGLVGRALAEQSAALGVGDRLAVRNLVMVAPPNAGTALADPEHLGALLDRMTNLLQFLPDNGVTDTAALILSVLKQLAVGMFGGLEGITAMDPDGDYLTAFNDGSGSGATYRVVTADFEPSPGSSLGRIARDGVTDLVFGATDNDLVVPTRGAYEVPGATGFPIADPFILPASAGVDHCSFFGRPDVAKHLLDWLPG